MMKIINKSNHSSLIEEEEVEGTKIENDTDLDDEYSNYISNKGLKERLFGQIEPGSLRGSITSLSVLSVGVSCISFPKLIGSISITVYIGLIIIVAIVTNLSLKEVISAGRNKKLIKYNDVVKEYCGSKWAFFLDIVSVVYIVGVLIVYQIVSKSYIIISITYSLRNGRLSRIFNWRL